MQTYRYGLSESTMYLVELYRQYTDSFIKEIQSNENLRSFIMDPLHFNYSQFDAHWWPLFRFSDIGMEAMKYGSCEIKAAVRELKGSEKKKAEYYIGLYGRRDDQIDTSDIYYVPDNIKNPRI